MCGIYGIVNKILSPDIINRKLDLINHRGPDNRSFLKYGNIALGHVRLSIIDLDERSNQPFEYLHLRIVFNGEIYNFEDIKNILRLKGYSFRTSSDTEVICASYLNWGKDCVNFFNGMFSFVIYDTSSQILFGARDRLGKKPFFYRIENNTFEFCSQLSPLILNNSLVLNQKNISNYLLWGHQPDRETVFQDVFKLEPGCRFTFNIVKNIFESEKYYIVKSNPLYVNSDISFSDAKSTVKDLLIDATKIRLLASDVPVGVFLSGGIDSSLVTAIASSISNSKINSYSIGFQEPDFDESVYAERISKILGTNHTTIYCSHLEARDLIVNYENYIDEPFADPSTIPSLLLAKHTREYVTVALTGDGGDELFLGYKRYQWIQFLNIFYQLPLPIRSFISKIISLFPGSRFQIYSQLLKYRNIDEIYLNMMTTFKREWFASGFDLNNNDFYNYLLYSNAINKIEKYSDFDIKYYLNDDINTKVDRSSMRFSLETRSPLMDFRIYNYVKSLPTKFKMNNFKQKILLKSILEDYIDRKHFERPKTGFGIPLKHWFKDELKGFVIEIIENGNFDNIDCLNRDNFQQLFNNHISGKDNNSIEIWRVIVLLKWLNKFYK